MCPAASWFSRVSSASKASRFWGAALRRSPGNSLSLLLVAHTRAATVVRTGFGPDSFDSDTQLTRKFFVKEKYAFEFGAQAYNTLNHPNFGNPTAFITSGSLGATSSNVGPTTSPYGSFEGASLVSGRMLIVTAKFSF